MTEQQKQRPDEERRHEERPGQNEAQGMASDERGAMQEEAQRRSVEAQHGSDRTRESVAQRADQMRAAASERTGQAREEASRRAEQAREEASRRLDTGVVNAGQRMEHFASTLRERSDTSNTPAMGQAADLLERGGRYLQQSGAQGVRGDLESYIREKPLQSVLIAAAGGFMLSRTFGGKRRSTKR